MCRDPGPMSYDDFIAELGKAGLSVRSFASLLGMRPNSISNNRKKGQVPGHLAVIAALLAELSLHDLPYSGVFSRIGATRKKPRGCSISGKRASDKQGNLELSL